MSISFGPFITCFFAIMFLTIYLYIALYHAGSIFQKNTKWLFFGILLIFIRLSVPVNFPFTVSIYSRKLLPRFTNPFCDHRIGPLKIYQWLLIVWIAVAVMKTLYSFTANYVCIVILRILYRTVKAMIRYTVHCVNICPQKSRLPWSRFRCLLPLRERCVRYWSFRKTFIFLTRNCVLSACMRESITTIMICG